MLRGAIAAVVTPLTGSGLGVDEQAIGPIVRFLSEGGADGVLVCGTTGEGILLTPAERAGDGAPGASKRGRRASRSRCTRARRPPPTPLRWRRTRRSTAPTRSPSSRRPTSRSESRSWWPISARRPRPARRVPFYVYEFAGRSGYAIPVAVIERLREVTTNLAGMKVSDTPFSAVEPYALEGLDLFVGSEPLVLEGMRNGAAGAVSALATAFPEIVASLVHGRSDEADEQVTALRRLLGPLPFHAALKTIMRARGVPVRPDVRAPLRGLTDEEREQALDVARAVGVEVASFDQAEA